MVTVEHKSMSMIISRTYKDDMSAEALYEAVRGVWLIDVNRAEEAEYAMGVCRGEVKEVYSIDQWHPAGTFKYTTRPKEDVNPVYKASLRERFEFSGRVAPNSIREIYVGKSVKKSFGSAILYHNI